MKLGKIHHVALIVSDYEKSKAFYTQTLGLPILRENYQEARGSWKLDLQLDGAELELFCFPEAPPRASYPEACGLRHLSFAVENIEDEVRRLQRLGVETEPIRTDDYTGKKMTFFRDPDGLPLELHE